MENQPEYGVVPTERYDMTSTAMSAETVMRQVHLIQQVMREAMRENEHYGVIPGCGKKPSLLKPGAEKLSLTFRLAPAYEVIEKELPKGHREYRVKCTLTHIPTGAVFGEGVGSCSTMEGKYRFRTGEVESTGKPVPKEYWADRDINLIGGKGFTTKKVDGKWEIVRQGEKVEHDNPADYYNTVLKMAKKRAHVDATLTATAASDIFTQDIEDMEEVIPQNGNPPEQAQEKKEHPQASPDKPMSEKQKKMLWAKMMEKKLSKEEASAFFKSVDPKTSADASSFIEGFDAKLKEFTEKKPKAVTCPEDGATCDAANREKCNSSPMCAAWG